MNLDIRLLLHNKTKPVPVAPSKLFDTSRSSAAYHIRTSCLVIASPSSENVLVNRALTAWVHRFAGLRVKLHFLIQSLCNVASQSTMGIGQAPHTHLSLLSIVNTSDMYSSTGMACSGFILAEQTSTSKTCRHYHRFIAKALTNPGAKCSAAKYLPLFSLDPLRCKMGGKQQSRQPTRTHLTPDTHEAGARIDDRTTNLEVRVYA